MGKTRDQRCLFIGIDHFSKVVGSERVRIECQEWIKGINGGYSRSLETNGQDEPYLWKNRVCGH